MEEKIRGVDTLFRWKKRVEWTPCSDGRNTWSGHPVPMEETRGVDTLFRWKKHVEWTPCSDGRNTWSGHPVPMEETDTDQIN
nr:hypothetical protein BgiMline_033686 [Biomphalaria glabrata]